MPRGPLLVTFVSPGALEESMVCIKTKLEVGSCSTFQRILIVPCMFTLRAEVKILMSYTKDIILFNKKNICCMISIK